MNWRGERAVNTCVFEEGFADKIAQAKHVDHQHNQDNCNRHHHIVELHPPTAGSLIRMVALVPGHYIGPGSAPR
jgi:hypothetical protein